MSATEPGAMPANEAPELLLVKEVMAWLRVSEPFVRRKVRDGVFAGVRVGDRLRIVRSSVRAYLDAQTQNYRAKGSRVEFGATFGTGRASAARRAP